VTCTACNQETTLAQIGTGEYCRLCGQRQSNSPRLSLDIRAVRQGSMSAAGAKPANTAKPASAAKLHTRVLDLRASHPSPAPSQNPGLAKARQAAITAPTPRTPAPPPKTTAHSQHLARFQDRFEQAKGVPRSQHIAKFGHQAPDHFHHLERFEDRFLEANLQEGPDNQDDADKPELPADVAAQHHIMAQLASQPHHSSSSNTSRTGQFAALAAVVVIIGTYIWLQNYPKLAASSAGHEAGIAATLPGYLPSSYSLAGTTTQPGLVTFRFSSADPSQVLTIQQQRTSWDSRSLLDHFVAKQTSDYSAIEGQGLTIYLYGQNRAAWVNHGIQYHITGAGRLSREQVLKIAYSL
jgi:hypothetical protein